MNIFLDLLPMILGTALAPAWIIVVLLILRSANGLLKAIAFVVGTTLVRLLQGIVFGYILNQSAAAEAEANGSSPVVSVLMMVLGLLLLISAVKKLIKEDDPDAPPPKWMNRFEQATVPDLLRMGVILTLVAPKLWVFTLSALGVIRGADLSLFEALKTYMVYMLLAEALIILPLLICAIVPRQSARLLQDASDWLMKYNGPITLAVSLIFGCLFLWKGISGLVV